LCGVERLSTQGLLWLAARTMSGDDQGALRSIDAVQEGGAMYADIWPLLDVAGAF